MFKRGYPLECGGQVQHLELRWGFFWRNFTIKLDSQTIGQISGGFRGLREGAEFLLPDGSSLKIQTIQAPGGAEFLVFHNGIPLHGSAPSTEPGKMLLASPSALQYGLLFLFAFLIPGALLLWLGIWIEEAATGVSDSIRCLLALGVFLAFLIFLPLVAAWRSENPKTIREWITAVRKVVNGTFRNDISV